MITSEITKKTYEPGNAVFISNHLQNARYIEYLGYDYLLDVVLSDKSQPKMLTLVWERCDATKRAKELWDQHLL